MPLLMYQMLLATLNDTNVPLMGYGTLAVILVVVALALAHHTRVYTIVLVTQVTRGEGRSL